MTTIPRANGSLVNGSESERIKLGLKGEVTPEQFEALRSNHHPLTREQLTPRTKDTRVASTREAGDDFRKKHHRPGSETEVELTD